MSWVGEKDAIPIFATVDVSRLLAFEATEDSLTVLL